MEAVVGEKSLIGQLGGGDKVHVRCRQDTLLGYTVLGCLRLDIPYASGCNADLRLGTKLMALRRDNSYGIVAR